jgi:maltose alpha-D-glucosyltransferase/alpha-amylase
MTGGSGSDPLWYKDAVIYEAHVRAFSDSNDDGVGDFPGLTRKLDYIKSLGVTAVWLLPFYPSPLKDDGYDIAHYEGVHPSFGTLRDFRAFMDEAHKRDLRVITELVINHTSDQHPWFQAARKAKRGSAKRDYYVWSDTDTKYSGVRIIFSDTERSNWTWDPVAGQYYWHRFFHHQPDLNFDNAHVRMAVAKIMRFWLDHGVDGLRLDAVPYLFEREGTTCANLPEVHDFLRELRRQMDARYSDRMLLAEANLWPSDVAAYFGDGDECHMAFHFPLMPRLFMALRQEDRHPLSEILYQTPDIPSACQWGIFLRNHDELTLEMVTDEERDYMYQTYAADTQMRVNAGIRRRLAPLMENSRRRIELMHGLLLSLPGTPVIYYGDEIGMGDNVYLGDRNGVRTPMQWSADRNAGFSHCDPARLYAPIIMDAVYGYQSVNVEAQDRSPFSMLNWFRRTIALRQQHKTFARGTTELLRPENRRIFAFIRRLEGEDPILVVANLSRTMQPVTLELARDAGLVPIELAGGTELPRITSSPYFMTLGPYAFHWLVLKRQPVAPVTVRPIAAAGDADTEALPLLLGPDWSRTLAGASRRLLERDYLAPFLRRQRWVAASGPIERVRIVDWGTLRDGEAPVFVTILAATVAGGREDHYMVPLVLTPPEPAADVVKQSPEAVVAHVAGARKGVLHGAVDASVTSEIFSIIAGNRIAPLSHGQLRGEREPGGPEPPTPADAASLVPLLPALDRANSTVRLNERWFLKVVRRALAGVNPEVELGRFLGKDGRFTRMPRLAGSIVYEPRAAAPMSPVALPFTPNAPATVAVLNAFQPHQMDAWRHALGDLGRYFESATAWNASDAVLPPRVDLVSTPVPDRARPTIGAILDSAAMLGRRTADLHLALASDAAAEIGTAILDEAHLTAMRASMRSAADAAFAALEKLGDQAVATSATEVQRVLEQRARILEACDRASERLPLGVQLTRVHGSFDLEQALLSEGDYVLIDFEGDLSKSIDERRQPQSPLVDVAGMIRSLHYAANVGLAARQTVAPQDRLRLSAWVRWWHTWTSVSFLAGYRTTAGSAAFLPSDPAALSALLDWHLLKKVLWEIRHEAERRPELLWIALDGLAEMGTG